MSETTVFHPPQDTGLSHPDAYLSEHVEAKGYTPSELRQPGCYALELSVPQNVDREEHWLGTFKAIPAYWDELTAADRVVYVGGSKNVYERLIDHVEGEVRQPVLPQVYPVHSLLRVWLYDSADQAFLHESGHAIELANANESWFVHSN